MSQEQLFGGVEAGGTKFVCATGNGSGTLRASIEFPTQDPESTVSSVVEFFQSQSDAREDLSAIGVGSFGPLELNVDSPSYGRILVTPKKGWQNFDLRGEIARGLNLPVAIDTDVNAAAIGEWQWGALRGLQHGLYVTVGTGVGVGAIVDGQLLHGKHHPEMGHMLIPRSPDEQAGFAGVCPYHRSCVEGLASGRAIVSRWGSKLVDLPVTHPAWDLQASYLAMFLTNLTFALQPERVVVGGGVMNDTLLSKTQNLLQGALGGYRSTLTEREMINDYLLRPALEGRAGVLGAIALARAGNRLKR